MGSKTIMAAAWILMLLMIVEASGAAATVTAGVDVGGSPGRLLKNPAPPSGPSHGYNNQPIGQAPPPSKLDGMNEMIVEAPGAAATVTAGVDVGGSPGRLLKNPAPPSGPSHGHNNQPIGQAPPPSKLDGLNEMIVEAPGAAATVTAVVDVGGSPGRLLKNPAPPSGPSHGHNNQPISQAPPPSKLDGLNEMIVEAPGAAASVTAVVDVEGSPGRLLKNPAPPSGPSHGHNNQPIGQTPPSKLDGMNQRKEK